MAKIRTATKVVRPLFFDPNIPFVYAWSLRKTADEEMHAQAICALAERLYQLGRGIDMAWAWAEVLDDDAFEELLDTYPGRIYRPSAGRSRTTLLCPRPGSLESLTQRYEAFGQRFRYVKEGGLAKVVFRQPPRPQFQPIAYDSPPARQLYELREPTSPAAFAPWSLEQASALIVRLRDVVVDRLKGAMPQKSLEIDRALIGRKPDGSNACPPELRVRIIPLPSIGHFHADRAVRRVLVEVPPNCFLRAEDVFWAFSGAELYDKQTGEVLAILVHSDDIRPLKHYGVDEGEGHLRWRTVTPAVLPKAPPSRDRTFRRGGKSATGEEKRQRLERKAASVHHALRHAGVRATVETIALQRESFESKGVRAESFAPGTRFHEGCLWHVEIVFASPVSGPLVIGDGRFLGLGVMAPVRSLVTPLDGTAVESGPGHEKGPD
jgi:CRISPR-associated protein Csb2